MAESGYVLIGFTHEPEQEPQSLDLKLANRHGLIAGATGTGKTVTLQVLAEGLSREGVAVFASDIKGDLSGVSQMGDAQPHFVKRAQEFGFEYTPEQFPAVFWDLFGEQGHPVRASLSDMGPLLVSRLLELNDTQEGVLNIAFRVAGEQQIPLVDLADLRALLIHVGKNARTLAQTYGNVASQSVGAIQRQLLVLENQGADRFFGAPGFDINDLLRVDPATGRGVINILAADRLMNSPRLYATFLLWMLTSLFDHLPEVGDPPKPKLAFFFDEAHLLFSDAPKALLDQIERVVRLIRSKGVGVYFVTQNPLDVPESVLAQLGNRVQHALRAFTPRDQKAVRAAADTFRQNPAFDAATVITELAVGEALVSVLEGKGTPSMVQRTLISPPAAKVGAITPQQRQAVIAASPYPPSHFAQQPRRTAKDRIAELEAESAATAQEAGDEEGGGMLDNVLGGVLGGGSRKGRKGQSITEKVIANAASSAARTIGTKIGNAILKGIFGIGKR